MKKSMRECLHLSALCFVGKSSPFISTEQFLLTFMNPANETADLYHNGSIPTHVADTHCPMLLPTELPTPF